MSLLYDVKYLDVHSDLELYRLAYYYREALQREFPQYEYSLSISDEGADDAAFLAVFKNGVEIDNDSMPILVASFSSAFIEILYYGYVDDINDFDNGCLKRHIDFIYYADPKFTEDVLSDKLATYDKRAIITDYPTLEAIWDNENLSPQF